MIEVLKPGLLTTVQDLGRYGFQKYGVVVGGAMDSFAFSVANLLVGNPVSAPALEMTLLGPTLRFHQDTLVAMAGFGMSPRIAGTPLPKWRPVFIPAGSELDFAAEPQGCRMYLAVGGGLKVAPVMGSASTYIRGHIGGYQGRPLQKGDKLEVNQPTRISENLLRRLTSPGSTKEGFVAYSRWFVGSGALPRYRENPQLRVLPGGQYKEFTEESHQHFFTDEFSVTIQSDRMGYRLKGRALERACQQELLSEAVAWGTVQVPSDGNPIILLADRQTLGGYPKIAQVIGVDLPVIAQVRPGGKVRFQRVDVAAAQDLFRRQHWVLGCLQTQLRRLEG